MGSNKPFSNEVVDERLKNSSVYRIGQYVNSNDKIEFGCKTCGNIWRTAPRVILRNGAGCPNCSHKNSLLNNEIVDEKLMGRSVYRIGNYVTSLIKIEFGCNICSNRWDAKPANILYGQGCPKCGKSNSIIKQRFTNKIVDDRLKERTVYRIGEYQNNASKIEFGCKVCGNIWKATPANVLIGQGCKKCAIKANANKKRIPIETIDLKLKEKSIRRIGPYLNNSVKIKLKCDICGNIWNAFPIALIRKEHMCPSCSLKHKTEKAKLNKF